MKKFLKDLISDDNKLNEKSLVGLVAFVVIVIIAIADIVTGIMQKELTVHQWIFDGLLFFVAAVFGISNVDKWINNK